MDGYRSIEDNMIKRLDDGCFSGNRKLALLKLKDNPISSIGHDVFVNLGGLEEL